MARDAQRVAVIDIGTNSTRLLVADVDRWRVAEVERRSRVTRLGRGVDLSGQLSAEAIEAACDAIGDYVSICREAGAGDGRRDRHQRRPRRLQRERLRRRAAGALRALGAGARRRGGGAAHLPRRHLGATTHRADPGHRHRRRLDRADRRHRRGDRLPRLAAGRRRPPHRAPHRLRPAHRRRAGGARRRRQGADRGSRRRVTPRPRPSAAIAVAGTPTSLAAIELGLEPYDPAAGARIRSLAAARSSDCSRARLGARSPSAPGSPACIRIAPRRSSPACVILIETMRAFGLERIEVSEHDILYGTAIAAPAPMPTSPETPSSPASNPWDRLYRRF